MYLSSVSCCITVPQSYPAFPCLRLHLHVANPRGASSHLVCYVLLCFHPVLLDVATALASNLIFSKT
jgi:hypothetical protein